MAFIKVIPVEDRFFSYVNKTNSCWEWRGSKDTSKGRKYKYGRFRLKEKYVRAHRWSYEFHTKSKIPEDMVINHICKNILCVNPKHLEVVTQRENVLKGKAAQPKPNIRKLYCKRGHSYEIFRRSGYYTQKNGKVRPWSYCYQCCVIHVKNYQTKKKLLLKNRII